jgi:ComF family protein
MGDGEVADGEILICDKCKANPPNFKRGMSCWLHKGVGRDIVLTLKYRNAEFLRRDISQLLKNHRAEVCTFVENSLLVPVPMHYFRRVRRGYNQSEVIANAIAKIASGVMVANMLRSRHKKPQTELKQSERWGNVENMFECRSEINNFERGSKIVLVDDVITTGATVRECCKVLRNAGFMDLHVLTLSHG